MHNPLTQFTQWFNDAKAHPAIADATAMTVATATPDGKPAARILLLKGFDVDGFVFYGNMESRKFRELAANPQAALLFYWAPLDRQVRIEGTVTKVSDAEADAYFATRDRGKQIGAWASFQSQPLENRDLLRARIEEFSKVYEGMTVPRPPHWSGWRLCPTSIEFWCQGEYRLHTRDVYTRANAKDAWAHTLLYP
jgi:pyridoxamine 5'-phosphate oxidase